jgi:hypothetical protein
MVAAMRSSSVRSRAPTAGYLDHPATSLICAAERAMPVSQRAAPGRPTGLSGAADTNIHAAQMNGPTSSLKVAAGSHGHARRDDMRLIATRANPRHERNPASINPLLMFMVGGSNQATRIVRFAGAFRLPAWPQMRS